MPEGRPRTRETTRPFSPLSPRCGGSVEGIHGASTRKLKGNRFIIWDLRGTWRARYPRAGSRTQETGDIWNKNQIPPASGWHGDSWPDTPPRRPRLKFPHFALTLSPLRGIYGGDTGAIKGRRASWLITNSNSRLVMLVYAIAVDPALKHPNNAWPCPGLHVQKLPSRTQMIQWTELVVGEWNLAHSC